MYYLTLMAYMISLINDSASMPYDFEHDTRILHVFMIFFPMYEHCMDMTLILTCYVLHELHGMYMYMPLLPTEFAAHPSQLFFSGR